MFEWLINLVCSFIFGWFCFEGIINSEWPDRFFYYLIEWTLGLISINLNYLLLNHFIYLCMEMKGLSSTLCMINKE